MNNISANKDKILTIYEDRNFKNTATAHYIRGECVCNESAIYIPVLPDGFVTLHLKNTHKNFNYLKLRVFNFVSDFNEFIQNKNIEVAISFNKRGEARIAFNGAIKNEIKNGKAPPIVYYTNENNKPKHLIYADTITIPKTIELSRYN